MAKPRPTRIPSEGCSILIDGQECMPHEGEWVELFVNETVGELRFRVRMAELGVKLEAIRGEPDEGAQWNRITDEHYGELVRHLARRILAWSWTDDRGLPLPPPSTPAGEPLGLWQLRPGELYWLMNATAPREAPEERKNG